MPSACSFANTCLAGRFDCCLVVQCSASDWTAAAAERHFSPAAFPERSSPSPAGDAPAAKGACMRNHLNQAETRVGEGGGAGGGQGAKSLVAEVHILAWPRMSGPHNTCDHDIHAKFMIYITIAHTIQHVHASFDEAENNTGQAFVASVYFCRAKRKKSK